jgi:RNA polymerase sigma factor (TIGR02999 family)
MTLCAARCAKVQQHREFMAAASDITQLLAAWSDGDKVALEKLVPLVEAELHRLAQRYLRGERQGHTLQTTALVNEAYLRLINWKSVHWQNRAHFLGVSAKLMRNILVDYARRDRARKAGAIQVSFDGKASIERGEDLVALDAALTDLAAIDLRKSQIIELRFFGGLTVEETAEVLKISPRTVKRDWSLAQAWLYAAVRGEQLDDA